MALQDFTWVPGDPLRFSLQRVSGVVIHRGAEPRPGLDVIHTISGRTQ